MCAIMGFVEQTKKANLSIIKEMQSILSHRGPDDSGEKTFNLKGELDNIDNIAIGFDRLSIRDLSLAGHQPMVSSSEDILIAFNGEIYNSEDYRDELVSKGYSFRGHSDTEIILALYHCYGLDEMLKRLDGMYAICLVDFRINEMYLIRDRLGEKPLYLYRNDNLLIFASEYKAFYAHPQFKAELNNDAVDEYFMFRYITGNDTLLKNVKNLEPGHYLKITSDTIEDNEYWSIPEYSANNLSFEDNKLKLSELLDISVKRRLISDVPVGLQLSGGVDSSYLASKIRQFQKDDLHTFGIVFDNPLYSEEKYMDFVNDKYKLNSHKYVFRSENFLNVWLEAIWHFEAPMNHEGTLGLLLLNRRAKDIVTVMLCGEGADETLAGYDRFAIIEYWRTLNKKHLKLAKRFIANILGLFLKRYTNRAGCFFPSVESILISQTQWLNNNVFKAIRPDSKHGIEKVYSKRMRIMNRTKKSGLRKFINYEIRTYMQDILMRADKISMASSLEVRVPFLMPELLEFETCIPEDQLAEASLTEYAKHTKKLLKSLSVDTFGYDFTYRQKCGFGMPIVHYMCSPTVSKYIEDNILPGIKSRAVTNYNYVAEAWDLAKNINESNPRYNEIHQTLWTCFSFEQWAQMYIDSKPQEWQHKLF